MKSGPHPGRGGVAKQNWISQQKTASEQLGATIRIKLAVKFQLSSFTCHLMLRFSALLWV